MPRKGISRRVGEVIEIADYEDKHRPENQPFRIDGIPIDPILRRGFDYTPNDKRDPREISDWQDRPYILTASNNPETWEAYTRRLRRISGRVLTPRRDFERDQALQKTTWVAAWPTGLSYEVRCLDGRESDRSTFWGMVASLDEALKIAKGRVIAALNSDKGR